MFFMLRYVPSSPPFSRTFTFQASWIFFKGILASIETIMWFLSSSTFMLFITFTNAWILNQSYISVVNLTWSWWLIFFYVCLYFVCKNLTEYYWIYVFTAIGPEFYDAVVSLTCSGVRLTLTPGAFSVSLLSLLFI